MIQGQWKTVVIAQSGDTSPEVDLGADFKQILVLVPDLDNATITIHIAKESGGTFFPQFVFDDDSAADFAHDTSATSTAKAVRFNCGVQFIKIYLGATQDAAARTFYVRGIN